MVAADTRFYRLENEKTIQGMGVTRVAVPSRSSKAASGEDSREHLGSGPVNPGGLDAQAASACRSVASLIPLAAALHCSQTFGKYVATHS